MPKTKEEFLNQLDTAQTTFEQTVNALSDAQLTELKDHAGWSVKDQLDHLAAWEQGIAALLRKQPRYEAMGLTLEIVLKNSSNDDVLNQLMRQPVTHRTLADTRAALRQSHVELLSAMVPLSFEDLFKPYSHYQPDEPGEDNGKPIIAWIIGNSGGHYLEHLEWIKVLVAA
jgi:hypothetical protein